MDQAPERVLALRRAGAEPLVLAGEAVVPAFLEVAAAANCGRMAAARR
jgi:hypothetical protein